MEDVETKHGLSDIHYGNCHYLTVPLYQLKNLTKNKDKVVFFYFCFASILQQKLSHGNMILNTILPSLNDGLVKDVNLFIYKLNNHDIIFLTPFIVKPIIVMGGVGGAPCKCICQNIRQKIK